MKTSTAFRCIALFAALGAANVAAAEAPGYTMTVWMDSAYGGQVVSGRYARAIDRLTHSPARYANSAEGQTNLCVAYAKTGELDKAIASCERAVAVLEDSKYGQDRRRLTRVERQVSTALAIALSNRGVLRVANGQYELASNDFRSAAELDTDVAAAATNLERFEARQSDTPQIAAR
ncbi:MAG: tetratricopeptide repeat protein [Pseudomonadota bacterium]